ncbi:CBS domain-containing protein [Candidatus Micrarchaeota archaeon]|nr:CBS domain-containing protein [Candidatus Micrarchaeota archaeon]
MKTDLVTIGDDASVYEAAKKMKQKNVGSLVVYDAKTKKKYGIVTNDDIVKRAVAVKKMDVKIRNVTSKPLVGVQPEADLSEAAKLMGNENLKRLVVLKDDRIVGIISSRDIIRISPSLYDLIAEKEHFRK